MKLSEIGTALATLTKQVGEISAKMVGLETKATAQITGEQHTAMLAEINSLKASIGKFTANLSPATEALTAATPTVEKFDAMTKDLATTKAQLADKKAIAEHGAAAAAEVAASQTTAALSQKTDVSAEGKTKDQTLRDAIAAEAAKPAAQKDPKRIVALRRELRAMEGISFATQLVPANPAK